MAAIGITLVALLIGTVEMVAQAYRMNERQAAFQVRAMQAGMPADGKWYAHECTGGVVAAGMINGSGHCLYIDGVQASMRKADDGTLYVVPATAKGAKPAVFASKAACLLVYRSEVTRGAGNGGRTNSDYVRHNAQCTVGHAAAHLTRLTAANVRHTGKVTSV
jgi:hypothetical protein